MALALRPLGARDLWNAFMGTINTLDFSDVDLAAIDPPEKGERTIRDIKVPALGLRLRSGGSRTWVLHQMKGGKSHRTTLGDALTIPVTSARTMAAAECASLTDTPDPVAPAPPLFGPDASVADLMSSYLSFGAKGRWKPSTVRQMKSVARSHIVPLLGAQKVCDLLPQEVARWYRDVSSQTTAARMALSTLSGLLLYAEDHGVRSPGANPCRGLRKKQTSHRGRHVSPAMVRRLWEALNRLQADMPDACDAIRLLLLTGARRSEILGLVWDRIVGPRAVLEDSKSGPRTIWLNAPARAILDRRKEEASGPFVFPSPRSDGPVRVIDRHWRTICKEAGINGIRVHDLRHHFASVAVSNGIDLKVVGQLLGHHDIDSTLRYAHLATGALVKSAGRVSALIDRSLAATSKADRVKRRASKRQQGIGQKSSAQTEEAIHG